MTEVPPNARRLLGHHWAGYAGISAFGASLRVVRLNLVTVGDCERLGLQARTFEQWLADTALHQRFGTKFEVPPGMVREFDLKQWWPFAGPIPWEAADWRPRVCMECLAFAYHSALFQLPGISRCPWHGSLLRITCPNCDRRWGAEHVAHGLVCRCGFDPVNPKLLLVGGMSFRAEREKDVERIRQWVEQHRRNNWLQPPSDRDNSAWAAMMALLEWSPQALPPAYPLLREAVSVIPSDWCPEDAGDFRDANPGLARLPSSWQVDLEAAIDTALFESTAPKDPTGPMLPMDLDPSQRIRALAWPVFRSGDHLLLDTSAMARTARGDVISLREALSSAAGVNGAAHWTGEEWRAQALRAAILRQTTCRTYREGIKAAVRKTLARYSEPRAYALHRPWVVIRREPEICAQIAWTALPSGNIPKSPPDNSGKRLECRFERQALAIVRRDNLDIGSARNVVAEAYGCASWEELLLFIRPRPRRHNPLVTGPSAFRDPKQLQLKFARRPPVAARLPEVGR